MLHRGIACCIFGGDRHRVQTRGYGQKVQGNVVSRSIVGLKAVEIKDKPCACGHGKRLEGKTSNSSGPRRNSAYIEDELLDLPRKFLCPQLRRSGHTQGEPSYCVAGTP